jgi:hypothetical protein
MNLEGNLQELRPSGDGGGIFVVDRNDQLFLSKSDSITRSNLDGSKAEIVLQFDPINTASEFIYYPVPQSVGGQVNVAIPAAEPFLEDAQTILWQIPGQGLAVQLGTVDGSMLFDPIYWSNDGNRLAFVQQDSDPDAPQPARLVNADSRGINPDVYAADERLMFHAWSNDSANFLYSGNGYYTVGKIGAPPAQFLLAGRQMVNDGQWITESAFITAVGEPGSGSWELRSADLSGASNALAEIRATVPLFDVWQAR